MSVTGLLFDMLDSAGDEFHELLNSFGCVYHWARRQGVEFVWPEEQPADAAAPRRLRDGLTEGVLDPDRPRAYRMLVSLAQVHHLVPALVTDGGVNGSPAGQGRAEPAPPILVLRTWGKRVSDVLPAVLVWEAIRLHASGEVDRLGECQARRCARLFVDDSPHRTRRFCSTPCGTRDRVDRHRASRARGERSRLVGVVTGGPAPGWEHPGDGP